FAPAQILTLQVDFRGPQYRDQQVRHAYATALLAKARILPGVLDAAITTNRGSTMLVVKENEPLPPPGARAGREAPLSGVSSGFAPMLGMSLVRGRWLNELETGSALINETLAQRDFTNRDPIGGRIKLPFLGDDRYATIVGVVRDLKYTDIDRDVTP